MGDYNADPSPDLDKMRMVTFGYGFLEHGGLQCDQLPTASSLKVFHVVKQINGGRVHILVDPAEIPGI